MAYPTPYPAVPAPSSTENQMVQQLSMPIYQARGWLKFLGVLTIIGGIPSVFVLVGILQIWIGILLFQAGSSIDSAGQFGDKFAFLRSLGSMKTYFVIQGILALIGIIVVVSMLCITFVLPLLGLTLIPWQQIINNNLHY
jgi:Family of unknown function (DUF5362)